ncbi:hypothetical protein FGO68_gene5795 [Halteria grandinella]|uniref:Uncharacterized protein n=1 Tax=Halteria grandinella TaxID=5974 RepID=A0A8J8T4N1_HALGN|nr:hypothetical protein FGO68_gene5795 [Halteria grandinella]
MECKQLTALRLTSKYLLVDIFSLSDEPLDTYDLLFRANRQHRRFLLSVHRLLPPIFIQRKAIMIQRGDIGNLLFLKENVGSKYELGFQGPKCLALAHKLLSPKVNVERLQILSRDLLVEGNYEAFKQIQEITKRTLKRIKIQLSAENDLVLVRQLMAEIKVNTWYIKLQKYYETQGEENADDIKGSDQSTTTTTPLSIENLIITGNSEIQLIATLQRLQPFASKRVFLETQNIFGGDIAIQRNQAISNNISLFHNVETVVISSPTLQLQTFKAIQQALGSDKLYHDCQPLLSGNIGPNMQNALSRFVTNSLFKYRYSSNKSYDFTCRTKHILPLLQHVPLPRKRFIVKTRGEIEEPETNNLTNITVDSITKKIELRLEENAAIVIDVLFTSWQSLVQLNLKLGLGCSDLYELDFDMKLKLNLRIFSFTVGSNCDTLVNFIVKSSPYLKELLIKCSIPPTHARSLFSILDDNHIQLHTLQLDYDLLTHIPSTQLLSVLKITKCRGFPVLSPNTHLRKLTLKGERDFLARHGYGRKTIIERITALVSGVHFPRLKILKFSYFFFKAAEVGDILSLARDEITVNFGEGTQLTTSEAIGIISNLQSVQQAKFRHRIMIEDNIERGRSPRTMTEEQSVDELIRLKAMLQNQ